MDTSSQNHSTLIAACIASDFLSQSWCQVLDVIASHYFCVCAYLYNFSRMVKLKLCFLFDPSLAWYFPQISQCSGGNYFVLVAQNSEVNSHSSSQKPDPPEFTTRKNTAFTIRPNSQVHKKHVFLQFQSCVKTGHRTHCVCVQDTVPFHKNETGFPCGSAGKESTCSAGNLGSIPELGRSPREGNGYPLQYSCILAWRIPWTV